MRLNALIAASAFATNSKAGVGHQRSHNHEQPSVIHFVIHQATNVSALYNVSVSEYGQELSLGYHYKYRMQRLWVNLIPALDYLASYFTCLYLEHAKPAPHSLLHVCHLFSVCGAGVQCDRRDSNPMRRSPCFVDW
jgi:hypothetical protein